MNYRKLPDGITLPYKRLPKVLTAIALFTISASASAAAYNPLVEWIKRILIQFPSTFS